MREDAILHKMQTGDPSGLESLMDIYISYVSTVVWNILRGAMSQEDGEESCKQKSIAEMKKVPQNLHS